MITATLTHACVGPVLVVRGRPEGEDGTLAIVSALAEADAKGTLVRRVVLEFFSADDQEWLATCLLHLRRLGRLTVLRTARVLPRALVARLAESQTRIELTCAHLDSTVQRALVHPEAASVRELLCHAQYLKAVGLQVSARIVPIVAGLHDSSGGFMPLVRAIAAADICDVSLRVGALSQGAMDALARSMDAALALCVARAYQTQDAEAENSRKDSRGALWQLRAKTSRALEEGLLGLAREAGMHVYGCDCGQQCDLDRAESPSPIARTLFASIDSPVASLRPERSEELSGAGAFFESGLASRDVVLAGHRRRQNRKASNEDHGQGFTAHQLALLGT